MTINKEQEFYAAMGWRLKMLRQSRGMSQEYLGQLMSVTYQTVQKYEEGTVRIPPRRLEAFTGIFKVPVGYFFGESDADGQRSYSAKVLILAAEIDKLPSNKVKKHAYHFIRSINEELETKDKDEETEQVA